MDILFKHRKFERVVGFFIALFFLNNLYVSAQHQHNHEVLWKLYQKQDIKAMVLQEAEIPLADYQLFKEFIAADILKLRQDFLQKAESMQITASGIPAYAKNDAKKIASRYNDFLAQRSSQIAAAALRGSNPTPQACGDPCTNPDFETGDYTGWNAWTGTASTGADPTGLVAGFGQCTMMTAGGYDPIVGGTLLPVTSPTGNFSVRLGDATYGGYAARISQSFTVTAANANFTYKYAVVLEDPVSGHTDAERPYFRVKVRDQAGNELSCGGYDVIAKPPLTGFTQVPNTNYYWRNWTTIFIPLQAYIGQCITLEFTSSDCVQTGHLGYAYVDASCSPLEIISSSPAVCGGSTVVLNGPSGAGTYSWTGPGIVGATNTQNITIDQGGTYDVTMTSVSNPGAPPCTSVATITVPSNPSNPVANFSASSPCSGSATQFNDLSQPAGSITQWAWDFNNDGVTDNTAQNPTYTFAGPGTYPVKLSITWPPCVKDTIINVVVNPGPNPAFTATTPCVGGVTTFTDASTISTGTITGWDWDFADGSPHATIQNPTHTYATSGTFPVILTVSSDNGCQSVDTMNVIVNPMPLADFSPDMVCQGVATTFTDQSVIGSAVVTNWTWDFGDSGSSTLASPSHLYASGTNYNVTLTITTDAGCSHDTMKVVTVNPVPQAAFSATAVCLNAQTDFSDLSTVSSGTIDQWSWNYGDLTANGNTQNTSHTYATDNTYSVTLLVTTDAGCVDSVTSPVVVNPLPVASFSATTECQGLANQFTNSSTISSGSIVSHSWNFGDASGVSSLQNPSYTYSLSDTFSVSLLVISDNGCRDSITADVIVNPIPVADFSVNDTCFGLSHQFNDLSSTATGSVTSWTWDFGDASPVDLNQNPTHTYPSDNTFNAILMIENSDGCRDTITKTVIVHPLPQPAFSAPATCLNTETQFTDLSTISSGSIVSWGWDFGDLSAFDLSQNPSHQYASPGIYTVTFAVASDFGCVNFVTGTDTVFELPVADFSVGGVCLTNASNFIDQSSIPTGTISSWSWDFGEPSSGGNNTSTLNTPAHTYSAASSFDVTLIVNSNEGCTDTIIKSAIVNPLPVAQFSQDTVCLGTATSFTDNSIISTGAVDTWSWNFGEPLSGPSNISTLQNPTHTYGQAGTFSVILTVTSDSGCQSTTNHLIRIKSIPVAAFTADSVCLGIQTTFTDISQPTGLIDSWAWDFNNDGVADNSSSNVTHTYQNAGNAIPVTLTVTQELCSHDTVINVMVNPLPVPDFSATSVCLNNITQFTDLSQPSNAPNGVNAWSWDFNGDNVIDDTNQSPSFTFSSSGTFAVSLTSYLPPVAAGLQACSEDTVINITVHPLPDAGFSFSAVCYGNPTGLADTSNISSGTIDNWYWDFNNDNVFEVSGTSTPVYQFGSGGTHPVGLVAESNFGCTDTVYSSINVYHKPIANAIVTNNRGCEPVCASFDASSSFVSGANPINTYEWNFGDAASSDNNANGLTANHCYAASGNYSMELIVTTQAPENCRDTLVLIDTVIVHPLPEAEFSSYPQPTNILNPNIEFTNLSSPDVVYWNWDFGDGDTSLVNESDRFIHVYKDTGTYLVHLLVENLYGCIDSVEHEVYIGPEWVFYVPNAFTPNKDGKNDTFIGKGMGVKEDTFEMLIFDRWGKQLVNPIKDYYKGWDGKVKGSNQIAQQDVYIYKISFENVKGEKKQLVGTVTLLK